MVVDVDGGNQLEMVVEEVVVATLMADQKLFLEVVYLDRDLMEDGVEIILQEHQTMLLEEVVEQVVQEEIIVKDLLEEEVAMDYYVIFLDLLFVMELVVEAVYTPMVLVALVALVAVELVDAIKVVNSALELTLLDLVVEVEAADILMLEDLEVMVLL